MASRPGLYLNWVTSGTPTNYISQPSSGQQMVGFAGNQHPPMQYLNWLFYYCDQWVQWLDYFTQNLSTQNTVSATAATTTGTTNGTTLLVVASATGIYKGSEISRSDVPAGTVVSSISGLNITMSAAATGSNSGTAVSFVHQFATATTLQSQLDQLDAECGYLVTQFTTGDLSTGSVSLTGTTLLTSANNGQCVEVNTTSGPFTITMPASPTAGFKCHFKDIGGAMMTNQLTINGNGKNIEGLSSNYVVYANYWDRVLFYDGTAYQLM